MKGGVRAIGVITTQLTEEARQRHQLSYVATAALGRTMSAGLLFASSLKTRRARVNIRIRGNGPLGDIHVDAGLDGTVRGYVQRPDVELPLKAAKLDVGGAVGRDGYVHVIRDQGYGTPYTSTVELVSGEIGDDLTHYLATSEQTPSALILGEYVNPDGVIAAGGLLIQVLPKAARDEALVEELESRITSLASFTSLLLSGKTLPDIFAQLLDGLDLLILPGEQDVRFYCGCSQKKVLEALKLFGSEELHDMIDRDGGAEARCDFCNTIYQASREELVQIVGELEANPLA